MNTVLLIEDNDAARRALCLMLTDSGYRVLEAGSGRDGLQRMSKQPDIVILDLMLPDSDGFDVLARIRAASDVPIVILSGRSDSQDIVTGLRSGADDYISKPVVAAELTARLSALLRRVELRDGAGKELRFGDLTIRPREQTVHKDGQEVGLTRTEYRLLHELASHPTEVVTRQQLLMRVWGYDYFGDTRLLDVHIRRLRTKIEDDPSEPQVISTVRGAGYKLQA